jgi:hypothetical protein
MSVCEIHECIYALMCLNDMEAPMVLIDGSKLLAHIIFVTMTECRTCSIRPEGKLNIGIPKVKYQAGKSTVRMGMSRVRIANLPQDVGLEYYGQFCIDKVK